MSTNIHGRTTIIQGSSIIVGMCTTQELQSNVWIKINFSFDYDKILDFSKMKKLVPGHS